MISPAVEILAKLSEHGIEVVPDGDDLLYRPQSAMTPELAERMKAHKPAILSILRAVAPNVSADTSNPDLPARLIFDADRIVWEGSIKPPKPCSECGGIIFWWNPLGDQRCMVCDPPLTADRFLEYAKVIRRSQYWRDNRN